MATPRRIPTPLKRRLHLLRMRVVPLTCWLVAVAVVAVMWRTRTMRLDTPGMIQTRQAAVAAVERGTIASLHTELFGTVRASQVVVRLDDAAVRAALAVAEAEVKRLEAALRAAEAQLKQDVALRELDRYTSARTYATRVERLRIEKLDRLVELETDRVELQRLAATLERSRKLRARDVIAAQDLDDVKFGHEAMQRKIKATQEALEVIDGRLSDAMSRSEMPTASPADDSLEVALAPLREEMTVQLRRVDEMRVQREALVLKAPIDGVVTAVFFREGEAVMPGIPILTVSDSSSMHIVSFVEQGLALVPTEGMTVEVRRRTRPMQVAQARVVKVSPQVEPIPQEVLGSVPVLKWGVRVFVDMPASMRSPLAAFGTAGLDPPRPGELLDVRYFVPHRGGRTRVTRSPEL
ncbi:MAG: efflux RND transporter periplasmic adaptor subunit [Candidatus Brocadiae bacterium]|nr:efflux RND transporter periplasmic adaptor subunit [Candidatus Brocadiia bacterium]